MPQCNHGLLDEARFSRFDACHVACVRLAGVWEESKGRKSEGRKAKDGRGQA
jgi:hypothetical protein